MGLSGEVGRCEEGEGGREGVWEGVWKAIGVNEIM